MPGAPSFRALCERVGFHLPRYHRDTRPDCGLPQNSISCCQGHFEVQREREIGRIVIGKTVLLSEFWQFEDFFRILLGSINRESFQPRQKTIDLVESDSLPPVGHEQAVSNFIKPRDGNYGAFAGKTGEDAEAILAARLIFEKPLERQRRVQHQITHRR